MTETSNPEFDALWRPFTQHALKQRPQIITRGEGCMIWDDQGNKYLDAMAGIWCVNVGFGRESLAKAAAEQMVKLAYTPTTRPADITVALAQRLTKLLPGDLNHVQLLNSGTEAVETALKMARQCARQRSPKQNRHKVIARYRGYHGWTLGALSATGQSVRKAKFEPFVSSSVVHVRPPDTYRYHCDVSEAEAAQLMVDEIEETIIFEGPDTIAAFIGEPVIGGGGVIVPPADYWKLVRALCDKYGILMIHDEVITGFGRTGNWFGCQAFGVVPDIMTMAKGITSGYVPMAATAANEEVWRSFLGEPSDNVQFDQLSTFGGHPVACAVSMANLDIFEQEDLVGNAARMGEPLGAGLRALKDKHPLVGDVRGMGLIWGVELVKPGSKEPLPNAEFVKVLGEAARRGVMFGRNVATVPGMDNVVCMSPPLILNREQVDLLVSALDEALTAVGG